MKNILAVNLNRCKIIFVLVFCLMIQFNCSKHEINFSVQPVEDLFESAMTDFQAKRYDQAIAGFSSVIFNYPGSRYAADAQYYLALSYFEKEDYQQAVIEFDFFIRNFPTSTYLESATVQLALAYLRSAPPIEKDQSQLLKAREVLEEFTERFPASKFLPGVEQVQAELLDRLAHKEYNAATLYFRAREFAAAKVYYEHILTEYSETEWANKSKFPLAICYTHNGFKADAIELLEEIVKDDTDPKLQKKAAAQLKKLK